MECRGSGAIMLQDGKERTEVPIETVAQFLAGFLSSERFHRIAWIYMSILYPRIGFALSCAPRKRFRKSRNGLGGEQATF